MYKNFTGYVLTSSSTFFVRTGIFADGSRMSDIGQLGPLV